MSENDPHFCIIGAGAIGGLIAAHLSTSGYNTSCVARGKTHATLIANGIQVLREENEIHAKPKIYEISEKIPEIDYLFITLKANSLPSVAQDISRLISKKTTIVTGMNGIPHWYFNGLMSKYGNVRIKSVDPDGIVSKGLPPEKIIGSVIYPAAELKEPGVIDHKSGYKITLGEPDGSITNRIENLALALNKSGFRSPIRKNIRDEIWIKLLGNIAFNPLSALTGGTLADICANPGTREIVANIMIEAKAIGEKLGAKFPISIEKRIKGAEAVGNHKTSMLQDLEAHRSMEIDPIVTAVQELGEITTTPTKVLDLVSSLLKQKAELLGLN
ncbi:MAG: oxidoreductase [Rhodobacteraceae bacterium]|nr:MAG: oxidoreductase [Paracoccaceae bacterium]